MLLKIDVEDTRLLLLHQAIERLSAGIVVNLDMSLQTVDLQVQTIDIGQLVAMVVLVVAVVHQVEVVLQVVDLELLQVVDQDELWYVMNADCAGIFKLSASVSQSMRPIVRLVGHHQLDILVLVVLNMAMSTLTPMMALSSSWFRPMSAAIPVFMAALIWHCRQCHASEVSVF
jgi:hypothetical protein